MLLWLSPQHTPSTRWCLAPSSALTRTTRPGVISTAYYISDFRKETCLEHSQRGRGAPWLLWMGEVCKTSTQYSVRHLFLIGVLGNFKCSATSSLTTAWSGQVGRRERWLSTSLFDTWSVPSTNSAESGDFPSSFKGLLWSHKITKYQGGVKNLFNTGQLIWEKMSGTGRGSFISNLHKRLPLPMEAAW